MLPEGAVAGTVLQRKPDIAMCFATISALQSAHERIQLAVDKLEISFSVRV